ncbi:hypothetical protein JTB14_029474, partial [Gonioctena quinquepunctata]
IEIKNLNNLIIDRNKTIAKLEEDLKTERDEKMDVFQEQERFRKETVEQRELWAKETVKLRTELENINEIVEVNEKEAEENLEVRLEEEEMMMLNEADSDREAYQRLLNDHHILGQYNVELKNLSNGQGSQGLHRRNNEMPEHHRYGSVRSTISNSSARKKLENIDWKAVEAEENLQTRRRKENKKSVKSYLEGKEITRITRNGEQHEEIP